MLSSEGIAPGSVGGAVSCRCKTGASRLEGGYQMPFAVADQVGPAQPFEGLSQQRPVSGVVIAQKGLVQAALLETFG